MTPLFSLRTSGLLLLVFGFLIGCAGTKKLSPYAAVLGDWDYTVMNTPQGDIGGTIHFEESEDGTLMGYMTSELSYGQAELRNLVMEGNTVTYNATLDVDGQSIELTSTANVEGMTMTGSTDATGYGTFETKATRKPPAEVEER